MRRSLTLLATVAILIGLVAAPAAADRDQDKGNLPHHTWIFPAISDRVVQVPTGEWITIFGGWGTKTAQQRDDFLESVTVEIELDGVPQEVRESAFDDNGAYVAMHSVLSEPGPANKAQVWRMRLTFDKDHYDGWDWYYEGQSFDDTVMVVWVPRGKTK